MKKFRLILNVYSDSTLELTEQIQGLKLIGLDIQPDTIRDIKDDDRVVKEW